MNARAWFVALGLTIGVFPVAQAINYDWNGSFDSDWLNAANWTPGGPPRGGDGNDARFYAGAPRAASITADTPVVQDIRSGNDGTVGIRQIDQSAGSVNLIGWMRLGVDPDDGGPQTGAGAGGTYNMSGGTLNAGSFRIGEATGATATVNLSGTAAFTQRDTDPAFENAWTRIGEFGNAAFNLSGSATTSFDSRVLIGGARSSSAVITQTGGTFEVRRGELVIGDTGGTDAQPITYHISAGTLRTLALGPDEDEGGNITIGQWDNSRGLLRASGTATVHAARDIHIAVGQTGNPTGTLTISDDASVTFARRLMSGRKYDRGGTGDNNGGIINLHLSGNGVFRQDDVLDLDAETNWNFFAHNPTSVANVTVTGGLMSFDARTYFARNGSGTFNQSGGVVEVRRGELNFADEGSAMYNLSGGILRTMNGGSIVVGRLQNSNAQVTVSGTGVLNSSSDLIVGNGEIIESPLTGTINQTGGQVSVGGKLLLGNASFATGTYNLQGGVLDMTNGEIQKGGGTANFNFTGGRLNNATKVGFSLNQQGGTLAPTTAQVINGIPVGTLIDGAYSLLAPGTIEFSIISPTVADMLSVNGGVSLAGSLLVVEDTPGLAIGSSFTIINNDEADPISGTFLGLPEGQDFSSAAGNFFDISYVGGTGNDVRLLVVVPEPSAAAILLGGAGLLWFKRRARSSSGA